MACGMFTEQLVQDAKVFLLRFVPHNWPDKYYVEILQQLLSALKRSALRHIHHQIRREKPCDENVKGYNAHACDVPVSAVLQDYRNLDKWERELSGLISAIVEYLIALSRYNTFLNKRRRRYGSSYTKAIHLPNVFKKVFC